MARPRLRRFLYLNAGIAAEFLAQVEGGIFTEEDQIDTARGERSAGVGAHAGPLSFDVSRGGADERTASRKLYEVAEARFTRLYDSLDAEEGIQYLANFDDEIWEQLRRGEVLEIEAEIVVPTIFQLGAMADGLESWVDFMRATGQEIDPEMEQTAAGVASLTQLFREVVVLASPAETRRFRFVVPLDPEFLRVSLSDVEGEATVFATLERKLRPGETWSLLDAMGLGGLPRAARRGMEKDLKNLKELEGSIVRPPAAMVTPVAIYR